MSFLSLNYFKRCPPLNISIFNFWTEWDRKLYNAKFHDEKTHAEFIWGVGENTRCLATTDTPKNCEFSFWLFKIADGYKSKQTPNKAQVSAKTHFLAG